MDGQDIEKIRALTEQLDAIVKGNVGRITIKAYDKHERECFLNANREGLVELGIKLIRCSWEKADAQSKNSPDGIPLEFGSLVTEDSDFIPDYVNRYELWPNKMPTEEAKSGIFEKAAPIGCAIIATGIIAVLVCGLIFIVEKVF